MSSEIRYGIAIELFALAMGLVQQMTEVMPPVIGWPVVIVFVIIGIVLIIHGRRGNNVRQGKETDSLEAIANEPQAGSLDTVTRQDRLLIQGMAVSMITTHGHMDLIGLLADRASGIPLNELMTRNCSDCGIPRNQKSRGK